MSAEVTGERKLKLAWISLSHDATAGYGKVGYDMGGALAHAGAEILGFRDFDWDWRIAVGGPRAWLLGKGDGIVNDLIWHSMFEANRLPPDWVGVLNRCAAVWVPAQWNVEVFRRSGVTRPLFVAGYGVRTDTFCPMKDGLPDSDGNYIFMWAGTSLGDGVHLGDRKGGELVIKAFRALNLPDARLVLKVNPNSAVTRINGDDRIMIIAASLSQLQYATLVASAHCFVYPSRGEGFGLQPLEAMACGLPVIAPAYSGMSEFIGPAVAVVLPTRGETTAHLYKPIYGHECEWADLHVDDVADRMRWCYDHREEAQAIGCRAAAYVADRWSWEAAGRGAYNALLQVEV